MKPSDQHFNPIASPRRLAPKIALVCRGFSLIELVVALLSMPTSFGMSIFHSAPTPIIAQDTSVSQIRLVQLTIISPIKIMVAALICSIQRRIHGPANQITPCAITIMGLRSVAINENLAACRETLKMLNLRKMCLSMS